MLDQVWKKEVNTQSPNVSIDVREIITSENNRRVEFTKRAEFLPDSGAPLTMLNYD